MATCENDVLFASFITCIVLATLFAQENQITRKTHKEMPLSSVFGNYLNRVLRDIIAYNNGYTEIYSKYDGIGKSEAER